MRFLLVGVALMIGGCAAERTTITEDAQKPSDEKTYTLSVKGGVISRTVRTVEIDGCEYLVSEVHGGYTLAHKGNCHNHGR